MLLDRLIGCVMGGAVGDASGFLVEGRSRADCEEYAKQFVRTVRAVTLGITHNFGVRADRKTACGPRYEEWHEGCSFRFGQISDDTQMQLALLHVLANNKGRFDGDAYAKRVTALFKEAGVLNGQEEDPSRGIVGFGHTTLRAVQAYEDGNLSWTEAAAAAAQQQRRPPQQSNGGSMRSFAMGLVFYGSSIDVLLDVTKLHVSFTHSAHRSVTTAFAIACAAKLACTSSLLGVNTAEPLDVALYCHELAQLVADLDPELAAAIRSAPNMLTLQNIEAVRWAVNIGNQLGDPPAWPGTIISSGAVQSFLWAVYAFLSFPDEYTACIAKAISGGGDADTTAAMAGGLSGARLGEGALPAVYTGI